MSLVFHEEAAQNTNRMKRKKLRNLFSCVFFSVLFFALAMEKEKFEREKNICKRKKVHWFIFVWCYFIVFFFVLFSYRF